MQGRGTRRFASNGRKSPARRVLPTIARPEGHVCQLGAVQWTFNATIGELATPGPPASNVSFQTFPDRQILSFNNLNFNSSTGIAFTTEMVSLSLSTTGVTQSTTVTPPDGPQGVI
jgi:hypothetical protein